MERKRQREIALAAVAAAIIGVAAFRIRSTTSGTSVTGSTAQRTAAAAQQAPNQKGQVTDVDLQALHAQRPEPVDTTRDPFRFKPRPAPPPPPAPTRPTVQGPPGPVEPPPPPRIPLKFIGIVGSAKMGRVAVLSDSRGVYYGKEGEVLEGRYRILKIGVESLEIAYIDGRGRQTIRLTGQ